MFYVYYLRSLKNRDNFYVGFSSDLKKRLEKHNKGLVDSTKPYLPWEIIFYESFANRIDAKRREEYLKTTKGRKALKLMLREYMKGE